MKIKIINLLNMISKGEEIPKKVMSRGVDWKLGEGTNHYYYFDNCGNNRFTKDDLFEELYELHGLRFLNDEVEIIEEEKKFTKEDFIKERMGLDGITREQFDERYEVKECNCGMPYCKGFIAKEKKQEKKGIPEKINCWYNYNGTDDKELTKIMLDELKDKYNEIIDYLKSKEE